MDIKSSSTVNDVQRMGETSFRSLKHVQKILFLDLIDYFLASLEVSLFYKMPRHGETAMSKRQHLIKRRNKRN